MASVPELLSFQYNAELTEPPPFAALICAGFCLQIQLRDIPGFVETRHQLLIQKPTNRNNWITFAVAHHLDKNYDLAVQVSLKTQAGTDNMSRAGCYIPHRHLYPAASVSCWTAVCFTSCTPSTLTTQMCCTMLQLLSIDFVSTGAGCI
jgi:hypothetical protein